MLSAKPRLLRRFLGLARYGRQGIFSRLCNWLSSSSPCARLFFPLQFVQRPPCVLPSADQLNPNMQLPSSLVTPSFGFGENLGKSGALTVPALYSRLIAMLRSVGYSPSSARPASHQNECSQRSNPARNCPSYAHNCDAMPSNFAEIFSRVSSGVGDHVRAYPETDRIDRACCYASRIGSGHRRAG
jgi:hypothetical protein